MVAHDHGAAWSRDGKRLVYGMGHDLYVANWDGSMPQKIATVAGWPQYPRFSPDGSRIRFTDFSTTGDYVQLWEVSAAGEHAHKISFGCCGDWTADGRYYLFSAYNDGRVDIWAARDGSSVFSPAVKPVKLTTGPLSFRLSAIAPAKDGSRAFIVGEQPLGELLRYDAGQKQFVKYLGGMSAAELDFSRDGKWVAYVRYPDMTLWRSRTDGTERVQLTTPPFFATMPRWSPDRQTIAFPGWAGKNLRVYLISAEGGEPQPLLPDEHRDEDDPNWSPDGKTIVFSRTALVGNPSDFDISTVDLASRKVTPLPGSVGLFAPRYSPEGRFISALGADGRRMMLFDTRTATWTQVATGTAIQYPQWSADGKYIYFSDVKEEPQILRLRVADRAVELVVTLKGIFRPTMPWGAEWNGITPEGAPLILRDVGIAEVYALELELP
jgi:Tol biopolymer transport system component